MKPTMQPRIVDMGKKFELPAGLRAAWALTRKNAVYGNGTRFHTHFTTISFTWGDLNPVMNRSIFDRLLLQLNLLSCLSLMGTSPSASAQRCLRTSYYRGIFAGTSKKKFLPQTGS